MNAVPSKSLSDNRKLAIQNPNGLPEMYFTREFVDAGRLMPMGRARPQRSAHSILRGQDPEGSQAWESASGAADKVRDVHQFENGEVNRPHHSAQRVGADR
jgi:hypothetical protein